MPSRYFHSIRHNGRQEQEPVRRVSQKTIMTEELIHSKSGNRGVELA